jgi:hypothetical protein
VASRSKAEIQARSEARPRASRAGRSDGISNRDRGGARTLLGGRHRRRPAVVGVTTTGPTCLAKGRELASSLGGTSAASTRPDGPTMPRRCGRRGDDVAQIATRRTGCRLSQRGGARRARRRLARWPCGSRRSNALHQQRVDIISCVMFGSTSRCAPADVCGHGPRRRGPARAAR